MSENKISRRQVLKTAALAATAPALLKPAKAVEKVLPQLPRTGSGEFTFEVIHDWLTPPSNLLWGDTHGLAIDSQGRIYVAHTVNQASVSSDAVVVYDADGKFITSWGAEYRG